LLFQFDPGVHRGAAVQSEPGVQTAVAGVQLDSIVGITSSPVCDGFMLACVVGFAVATGIKPGGKVKSVGMTKPEVVFGGLVGFGGGVVLGGFVVFVFGALVVLGGFVGFVGFGGFVDSVVVTVVVVVIKFVDDWLQNVVITSVVIVGKVVVIGLTGLSGGLVG